MKLSFKEWMFEVDEEIGEACGLTSYDLADYRYADAYANGESPKSVAKSALRAEGFPG